MSNRINLASDGPASSGKGTVARMVARRLDFAYIDSGAMYRAVALHAVESGLEWKDEDGLARMAAKLVFSFTWGDDGLRLCVNGEDVTDQLRRESIGNGASQVAIHPKVRSVLLDLQRSLARDGGVVMDGRDIGSVVLPRAELKIYLDASVSERANRRTKELESRGLQADYETIEAEIIARDNQDKNRVTAPLIQADDAVYVDTTDRTAASAADQIASMAIGLMGLNA